MFTQLFGHYLLDIKLINSDQLLDAMDFQKSNKLKLGVLAVNAGYMNAAQVEKVHEMQKQVDKKFGELAIEMGFLDENKLTELLSSQGVGYLKLGQALVDRGYISISQFEEALMSYKKDFSLSEDEFNALGNEDVDKIVELYCDFSASSYNEIYKKYMAVVFKSFVRFVESEYKIFKIEALNEDDFDVLTYQDVNGQISFHNAIAGNKQAFAALGIIIAKEYTSNYENIDTSEFIGELLNLINGLYLVNLSEEDIELEITPQLMVRDKKVTGLSEAYKITLEFSFGFIHVILSRTTPTFVEK